MRGLSDAAVIELWEQGRTRHPLDRALLLYGAAVPQLPRETLADRPIGERDAAVLELRNATFGARVDGWGHCPACAARFEFEFDGQALRAAAVPANDASFVGDDGAHWRLPTTRDLAALAHCTDAAQAALELARRCSADAREPDLARFEARVAELDPAADLLIELDCAACGHRWPLAFDPVSYCWEELEVRAQRLLDEVHGLARAYGWSEHAVLALSPARRAAYLERCA